MPTDFVRHESTPKGHVISLRLPMSLEAADFDALNDDLLALIQTQPQAKWVIDLSETSYLGSAMLGMLVNIRQQVKAGGGRLLLCGLSKGLLSIFRTCCMERLFAIEKDRAAALSA
jgi:anti-anti-sigma factor